MGDKCNSGFFLSQKAREEIAKLIGEGYGDRIEKICRQYISLVKDFTKKPPRGNINKELREIHKYTLKISSILENRGVEKELYNDIMLLYPLSRDFLQKNRSNLKYFKADLQILERATEQYLIPRNGRPPGTDNKPAKSLAFLLYDCCQDAGYTPTNINDENYKPGHLHKLLDILRGEKSLKIGEGQLDSTFSDVIYLMQQDKKNT